MRHRIFSIVLLSLLSAVSSAGEFDVDINELKEYSPPVGTVINGDNLAQFRYLLDTDIAALIAKGDTTITVGDPISFRPHSAYVHATEQFGGQARLEGAGDMKLYQGGRPFPGEPKFDDPQAGEKMAFNMRYLYNGDSAAVPEMFWQLRDMPSGKLENEMEFDFRSMRFMYRHVLEPSYIKDNPYDAYAAFFMNARDAGNQSGVKVLVFINRDDTREQQGWVYIPALERSQSLASFGNRESMFGSDILADDFLGYAGRIMDMDWRYAGSTYTLLPMYRHDLIETTDKKARKLDYYFADFAGKGNCFPKIHWQVRHSYLLEGIPKAPSYPISKRLFYIDAQTYIPALIKLYDPEGALWKITINGIAHANSHIADNNESGAPIPDAAVTIDLIRQRCTTIQLAVLINPAGVAAKDFDPTRLEGRRRSRRFR